MKYVVVLVNPEHSELCIPFVSADDPEEAIHKAEMLPQYLVSDFIGFAAWTSDDLRRIADKMDLLEEDGRDAL
jgi:hypothetical protein